MERIHEDDLAQVKEYGRRDKQTAKDGIGEYPAQTHR
jgi:hypothetical protein